jgi:ABC-type branched-subunit amino acid transport system ATPase component
MQLTRQFSAGLAAGVASSTLARAESAATKIGITIPLTGPAAESGNYALNGEKLALEAINAAGVARGKTFELVIEDDQTTNPGVVPAFSQLAAQPDILGSIRSAQVHAMAPDILKAGKPLMFGATDPQLSKRGNPFVLCLRPNDRYSSRVSADYGVKTLGEKQWAIIRSTGACGTGGSKALTQALAGLGVTPVLDQGYPNQSQELTPVVVAIKQSGPRHDAGKPGGNRRPHARRRAGPSRWDCGLPRSGVMALLEIRDLSVFYGEIEALRGIALEVAAGKVVGCGQFRVSRALASGEIVFDSHSIAGLGPEAIVRRGISRVLERRRIFPGLRAMENIMLGASKRAGNARQARRQADAMFELFPKIRPFAGALGWMLSGGQQMAALARGRMAEPRLLRLDEPSLGLAPVIVQTAFRIIGEIARRGAIVLLVEQNARMGLSLANRGYVLETGRLVLCGKPEEHPNDQAVRAARLGGAQQHGARPA